jgi:hypothetical protein
MTPPLAAPHHSGTSITGDEDRIEADHGRLKAQLRPMRGLKQDRNARVFVVPAMPSSRTFDGPLRAGR